MRPSKGPMPEGKQPAAPPRLRRAALLAAFVLAALASPAAAEQRPSLESVLAPFAAMPGLEARFREEKHITLLAAPLVSEGTLHFAPPGRLARHVTSPAPSSVVVSGGTLSFGDGTRSGSIELGSSPAVRLFVDSFLAILAGDRRALEAVYTVGVEPAEEGRWRLTLRPRRAAMRRILAEVVVTGRAAVLERMVVAEASGDSTVTTFEAVDPARRYGEDEARRIFAVPRPR